MNLEQALNRIEELEEEVASLKAELKKYENKSLGGRKKHDDKWQSNYDQWVKLYEDGETVAAIMDATGMSRRTFYRYRAYYEGLMKEK